MGLIGNSQETLNSFLPAILRNFRVLANELLSWSFPVTTHRPKVVSGSPFIILPLSTVPTPSFYLANKLYVAFANILKIGISPLSVSSGKEVER